MFTDQPTFFATAELLEVYFISAYIAAARALSGIVSSNIKKANPLAIGFAVQTAGVECEHRALLRVAAGTNPPNNTAFEMAKVACVSDAAAALKPFLAGGAGFNGPYSPPSKHEIDVRAQPYSFAFFPPVPIV